MFIKKPPFKWNQNRLKDAGLMDSFIDKTLWLSDIDKIQKILPSAVYFILESFNQIFIAFFE